MVERHRMQQRMVGVEGDPDLVEVNRSLGLAKCLDLFCERQEFADFHLRQAGAADGVFDEVRGERRVGGSIEHVVLIRSRVERARRRARPGVPIRGGTELELHNGAPEGVPWAGRYDLISRSGRREHSPGSPTSRKSASS